ncbi:MAG: Gfo/Idh/MocA family oxidoreductase [Acidimicrobiaceae bacterium]|nr:Gfo/Idh/MocA family oxidoreductase [Acidimicrobiaceae bacterium]
MADEIGVAVVGAGYWGPNLIRNFGNAPGWELRWVCDLDPSRAARALGKRSTVTLTDNLADVLDDARVDAVAIATPPSSHASLAIEAMEAGKHVLVEKPLASSAAEGEKMVDVAEDRGLVLMIDHTYCYTPVVRHLRELIRSDGIGEIQYIDSVRINLGLVQRDTDVFWDLAPHDLSILDFILPDHVGPAGVAASGADPIGAGQACVGYLTIPLTNGGIAHIHVNWLSPTKIRQTIVGGSKRMVVWDDLNPSQRLSMYDKGVEMIPSLSTDERRVAKVSYRTGDMVAPALPEREALEGVVAEFHAAISEGRQSLTDGRAGLRVLRILEATTLSMLSAGATVGVDA